MKAGKRLVLTGILIYPLALLICLMLVRGAHGPVAADHLMLTLYLIATFPLAIIVVGTVLLQKNR